MEKIVGSKDQRALCHRNIVMVPPLLSVRQKPKAAIENYFNKLIRQIDHDDIALKLHPKESNDAEDTLLELFDRKRISVEILEKGRAIEDTFHILKSFTVIGPPTTGILNALLLYPERIVGQIKVVSDKTNPFCAEHIDFFRLLKKVDIHI